MADVATKDDVQKIVDKAVTDISDVMANFAQNVHNEFQDVRTDTADIRQSIDRLTNTIDGFVKRLDDIETDSVARDAQIARLDRWVHQIAQKTGTKLET